MKCLLFGHKPTGEITGFRAIDGAVITRCRRCNSPIVATSWKASIYLIKRLEVHKNPVEAFVTDSAESKSRRF